MTLHIAAHAKPSNKSEWRKAVWRCAVFPVSTRPKCFICSFALPAAFLVFPDIFAVGLNDLIANDILKGDSPFLGNRFCKSLNDK